MNSITTDWKTLARGESGRIAGWLTAAAGENRLGLCVATIVAGTGVYGATIGIWHGPLMACYVGAKLPLIIFITLTVNGLVNGMLAQILGTGLSFRQTFRAILMSFSVFALIVGSLSPIIVFLVWNAPTPGAEDAGPAHRQLLVLHTVLIAFAGIVATQKLFGILRSFSGSFSIAIRTLIAWLAGNLFVGAQIGFLLRPIFGTPGLTIEFLRWEEAFDGNFYESVWWALKHL